MPSITIYTKPHCVQCDAAKRALDQAGITYTTVALTSDLPAAVVATQLGLSASATTMWAKFGQQDQSEYLLARQQAR